LARRVICSALGDNPQIEVVGYAADAHFAQEKLGRLEVDVVTLDLELPGVDGLSLLRTLLAARPLPVVVVSAFTPRGSELGLRALEMGALEVMSKPDRSLQEVGEDFAVEIADKVKAAAKAGARLARRRPPRPGLGGGSRLAASAAPPLPRRREP